MTAPRIHVDASDVTAVLSCADCPHWVQLALDRDEAARIADAHRAEAHPGTIHPRVPKRVNTLEVQVLELVRTGLKQREVAELVGTSYSHVRTILHRSRSRARTW